MFTQLSMFPQDGIYIKRLSYDEVVPYLGYANYENRIPCIQYAFGLFDCGEPIGCVTYGQPASPCLCRGVAGIENAHNVIELNRLVILPWHRGENYASILISRSIALLPRHTFVVAYADTDWGHIGYVYQATNWIYTGITHERTDKLSGSGHGRHYKPGEMRRQHRSAKHRYVYLVGTKADRRNMLKELRYKPMCYPKGVCATRDEVHPRVEIRKGTKQFKLG